MRKFLLLSFVAVMACSPSKKEQKQQSADTEVVTDAFKGIDIQGHRGARGLYPENTIPGFIEALKLGVNTLEMDLAISADKQLIVSHEPYMNAEICLDREGNEIPEDQQLTYNIYKMKHNELLDFDCGMKPHPRFPEQKKMTVTKPLLADVIDAVERHIAEYNLPKVNYNIEIKTQAQYDNVYHPAPKLFADLVYNLLNLKLDWSRVTIQSFDFRVIQYFHEKYPDVQLALLIENELPWRANIDSLGFTPQIYSCDYALLTEEIVAELQAEKMKVIPWTVNERADMDRLLLWGVDGLITDYPNRTK